MQVQATAAGTAHAIIIWWQLNLDPSGFITLDTAPCWVAKPASNTAPKGPHTTPQLVTAPDAAPLDGSSTAGEQQLTACAVQSQDAAPSRHHTHAASLGLSSCGQDLLAGAAQASVAGSGASSAVPEDCSSLEHERRRTQRQHGQWQRQQQGQQQRQQHEQQQWRDHWKQCWTPVQPHFELGKQQAVWDFLLGPPGIHLETQIQRKVSALCLLHIYIYYSMYVYIYSHYSTLRFRWMLTCAPCCLHRITAAAWAALVVDSYAASFA